MLSIDCANEMGALIWMYGVTLIPEPGLAILETSKVPP